MFQIAIDFQIIILIICHPASFLWLSSGSLKTFPCRAPHKRLIFSVSIGGGELRQHNAGGDYLFLCPWEGHGTLQDVLSLPQGCQGTLQIVNSARG